MYSSLFCLAPSSDLAADTTLIAEVIRDIASEAFECVYMFNTLPADDVFPATTEPFSPNKIEALIFLIVISMFSPLTAPT